MFEGKPKQSHQGCSMCSHLQKAPTSVIVIKAAQSAHTSCVHHAFVIKSAQCAFLIRVHQVCISKVAQCAFLIRVHHVLVIRVAQCGLNFRVHLMKVAPCSRDDVCCLIKCQHFFLRAGGLMVHAAGIGYSNWWREELGHGCAEECAW